MPGRIPEADPRPARRSDPSAILSGGGGEGGGGETRATRELRAERRRVSEPAGGAGGALPQLQNPSSGAKGPRRALPPPPRPLLPPRPLCLSGRRGKFINVNEMILKSSYSSRNHTRALAHTLSLSLSLSLSLALALLHLPRSHPPAPPQPEGIVSKPSYRRFNTSLRPVNAP